MKFEHEPLYNGIGSVLKIVNCPVDVSENVCVFRKHTLRYLGINRLLLLLLSRSVEIDSM